MSVRTAGAPVTTEEGTPGAAPVRVALVGTRGFGAHHLVNLDRLVGEGLAELVGVVDVAEPPAELAAIHHPTLGGLLEALGEERRPEVIIIATPIDTHVPLALEALAAGSHVYLEKPPVPALTDLTVLAEAADAAHRTIQVGFQARGGSMEPMLIYGCQAGLTAKRTDELKELTEEGN